MLFSVAVLALLASVQGRAVNISNTWVLPEEGFPVFYRYFRDRISWYEADAVCQFHHANLVTVDTTAQYDAVRAYLKELDISSAVWVGLIRSNPDGDFTWTDYRGLSGDGYWSSAPDTQSAPLCAAADPTADYRWEARACGGPTVASFICELPVPQWALGNEGCMVRALPALTILYLPESAAVQLTADCGMAGVKKVQCTGNVKREDLLKELSCADEEELSSTLSPISTGFNWPMSTDYSLPDQDSTNSVTTEETSTTEHEIDNNEHHNVTATSLPEFIYQNQHKNPLKVENFNKLNGIMLSKNVNLADSPDNNIHSNLIPKITDENTILTNDQLEKLEDEKYMKHKMLHEEIARVGNVENIFTQPTDHFIPPLVMAKAKISDDMTVLSLAEKHAQQLAEKQFSKHNLHKASSEHTISESSGMFTKTSADYVDRPLIAPMNTTKGKYSKKEVLKSNIPKKYLSEKHYDVKNKILKSTESKVTGTDHLTEPPSTTFSSSKETDIRTEITNANVTKKNNEEDLEMDLTVMLKDAPFTNMEHTSFTGDVAKLETIQNSTTVNYTLSEMPKLDITSKELDFLTTPETKTTEIIMGHEVIKITIIADSDTIVPNITSFEITTKVPVFIDKNITDTFKINDILTTPSGASHDFENLSTTLKDSTTHTHGNKTHSEPTTTPTIYSTYTSITKSETKNVTAEQPKIYVATEKTTSTEIITTSGIENYKNITEDVEKLTIVASTTSLPVTNNSLNNNTSLNATNASNETMENIDGFNTAEYHEILMNMTEHQHDDVEDMDDSDFQSPLLSGAMEPIHRPPRTRRPQQPNRNKFNPFRILG